MKTFVIETNLVSGPSMMPTFQDGDYLITDKLSYRLTPPHRGDIAIINLRSENKLIIKRVIGLPGDVLKFEPPNKQDGFKATFYLNGKVQHEKYIREDMLIPKEYTYKVKDNEVFVMGDNRNESADSRFFGPFSFNDAQGKVVLELKHKFQFHTEPTKYIIAFALFIVLFLVYLFYPYLKQFWNKKIK